MTELEKEYQALVEEQNSSDTQVDQMVLEFPILAEYALISLGGHTFYATHGHVYHQDHLPPLQAGDILLHGHTHLYKAEWVEIEEKGRIGIASIDSQGRQSADLWTAYRREVYGINLWAGCGKGNGFKRKQ